MIQRRTETERARALRDFHQKLSEGERVVLSNELDLATLNTLRTVAPNLSPEQLTKALKTASKISNESTRCDALASLAQYLSPGQLTKLLKATDSVQDEQFKARLLGGVAQYLSPAQLEKALKIAECFNNETALAGTLQALEPYLRPKQLGPVKTNRMPSVGPQMRPGKARRAQFGHSK